MLDDTEDHVMRCEVCYNRPVSTLRRWAGEWLCEECFYQRASPYDDQIVLQTLELTQR